MSVSHRLLIGSPLLLITLFCFGFLSWQQHAAQLSSAAASQSALSTVPPKGDLPVATPKAQSITPPGQTGTPPSDPEDSVTPQLPAVASSHIQQADQRREDAQANANNPTQAILQQLNSANGTNR